MDVAQSPESRQQSQYRVVERVPASEGQHVDDVCNPSETSVPSRGDSLGPHAGEPSSSAPVQVDVVDAAQLELLTATSPVVTAEDREEGVASDRGDLISKEV